MGLQDALVMSAVPAHDVINAHCSSAMSMASKKDHVSNLEQGLHTLNVNGDSNTNSSSSKTNGVTSHENDVDNPNINNNNNNNNNKGESVADDNDVDYDDDDIYDDPCTDDSDFQDEENKLSRALHHWMPHYVIMPLPRQAHTPRQPVFSAQLGRESAMRRTCSTESIETQLSLFSCSSHGSRKTKEKRRRRVRRRKTASAERVQQKPPSAGQDSRWVQLAKKRKGELDRFMMQQSHTLTQGINLTDESEAFMLCDKDEQRALFLCGKRDKLAWSLELKKSKSMTNIADAEIKRGKPRQRTASASRKTFYGQPIDFQELRRQMMNQRLAALSTHRRSANRRSVKDYSSLHRSHSRHSLNSIGSSEVFLSVNPSHNVTPTLRRKSIAELRERVSMWKGDSQILAIDLKRELTSKVKKRIAVTTTALERITGMGDDNEQRPYTCHLPEFPAFIDQDFALQPKISQKIRISPHLSDVIKSDIRVRMGRPRYHEIREQDVEMWNRGQTLNRAHRNLKVFNWLHSLKEEEFDVASLQQNINDVPPDLDDVTFGEMVLVRAVDEPDVKPLFQHKKTYIR